MDAALPDRPNFRKTVFQAAIAGLATLVTVLLVTKIPQFSGVPQDVERRLEATWLGVFYAVYATVLALFVVWKVGHKREGQTLGLLLAAAGALYAASVTPAGEAGLLGRWLITAVVALVFPANLLFWASFPQRMSLAAVKALDPPTGSRTWFGRVNRLASLVVVKMFESRVAQGLYGFAVLGFAYLIAAPGSYSYNIFLRTSSVAEEAVLNGCGFPAIFVGFAFTWTSFRLADAQQMRRLLWVALAVVITALWVSLAVTLGAVAGFSDLEAIDATARFVAATYAPLTSGINLTGVALAIFYSGALDLRPIINKTTIYTLMFIMITILFAGVEEIVESQIEERLGLADGIGTWIGAGIVAMTVGPIQTKLNAALKRVGHAIEHAGDVPGSGSPVAE